MTTEVDAMSTPQKPTKMNHAMPLHADPAHAPGKQHLDLARTRADPRGNSKQFARTAQSQRVTSHAPRGQRGT